MTQKDAKKTSVTIPDDLSPTDCLRMLEDIHDAVYYQKVGADDPLNPELKGYLLQLLAHLETLAKDSLRFLGELDTAVDRLDFANSASKILLRYEIARLPLLPPRSAQKILDAAHRALDARPPAPKRETDDSAATSAIGDSFATRPSWGD